MTWAGADWLQYLFGWSLVIAAVGGSAAVLIVVWRTTERD